MAIKSLFDGLLGKKQSVSVKAAAPAQTVDAENPAAENSVSENNGEAIEHLFITQDTKKNKKYKKKIVQKDPRVDTGILRNRIADKIAKLNNN